jgi:chromosome condensin MukBEF complex kleisin-like MukF subunit
MSNDCASPTQPAEQTSDTEAGRLDETMREIGVARFVGRINSGVIDAARGYQAVERFTSEQAERPLLSRLSHLLTGRTDTFARRRSR